MEPFLVFLLFGSICGAGASWSKGVYSGTKWCGNGHIAKTYDDLGRYEQLDKCCRKHDKCPILLKQGKSGWGLTNHWFHTRSSCECENEFNHCLKSVSGSQAFHANAVGFIYFQGFHPYCIRSYHPTKCSRKVLIFCVQWTHDKSRTHYKWQAGRHWVGLLNWIK